jgi:hypothetical protein
LRAFFEGIWERGTAGFFGTGTMFVVAECRWREIRELLKTIYC